MLYCLQFAMVCKAYLAVDCGRFRDGFSSEQAMLHDDSSSRQERTAFTGALLPAR